MVFLSPGCKCTLPFIVATPGRPLQDAINALPPTGGTVYLSPGIYTLTKPLNLTNFRAPSKTITLIGAGRYATEIRGKNFNGPIIDMTASSYCTIKDLTIRGEKVDVGILLAREFQGAGATAGHHTFENVIITGEFSKAAVYSMGSEVNRFYNCIFTNRKKKGYCFYSTPRNPLNVKSCYMGGGGGGGCNTELRFYGCTWGAEGIDSVGLRIDGHSSDVTIYGGYFACKKTGTIGIYLCGRDPSCKKTQSIYNVTIKDVRIEAKGGKYCLYTEGDTNNIHIEGGYWDADHIFISQGYEKSNAYAWNILNPYFSYNGTSSNSFIKFHRLWGSYIYLPNFCLPKSFSLSNYTLVEIQNLSRGNKFFVRYHNNIKFQSGCTKKKTVIETVY